MFTIPVSVVSYTCLLDLLCLLSNYNCFFFVSHACPKQTEKHRSAFCQQHYSAPFGYLSTPGYPSYYSPFPCRWSIEAEPGQRIHLQIIDLAIRDPNSLPLETNRRRKPGEPSEKCLDTLDIIDQDTKVRTLCGERNSNLIEYRSLSEKLLLEFTPIDFSPSRGILMKYSRKFFAHFLSLHFHMISNIIDLFYLVINCTNLRPPSNGQVQRNGNFAYYRCNFDQVFEDTGLKDLVLECVENHYWNGTVPRCVDEKPIEHEDLLDSQRAKLASFIISNLTSGIGAMDRTFEEKNEQNNEAYARFNRFLWITVILIALSIVCIFIVYQCVAFNVKNCFNRAGNYRIDEQPENV